LNTARLQTKNITDWNSFHEIFAGLMDFPDFYGRNMNAWIDCMSYLNDPDAAMTGFTLKPGELFNLEIADTEDFARRLPEIFRALIECTAFVNRRHTEEGNPPILALVFL